MKIEEREERGGRNRWRFTRSRRRGRVVEMAGGTDGLNEVLLVYRKIKRIRRELLAYYSFNRS